MARAPTEADAKRKKPREGLGRVSGLRVWETNKGRACSETRPSSLGKLTHFPTSSLRVLPERKMGWII